jgi:predicted CXXCH cytochrome family protein
LSFRHPAAWLGAGTLAVLGVAAWLWLRPGAPPQPASDDPRLTYPTPYRNVRPEVAYVGDETCASCHPDIAETFRKHPMGRSITPVGPPGRRDVTAERLLPGPTTPLLLEAARLGYDRLTHDPFEKFGNEFGVEWHGGRVRHYEARRDARGRVAASIRLEPQYEVGAGMQGYSYLLERQGCLVMSPISWYSRKGRWDISPGFGPDLHFDRTITVTCLFCHGNYADWVPNTLNRYKEPIFHGLSIGCERCHGPGELHVRSRERGEVPAKVDPTVVNPAKLDPVLRDAVCEQCHLEGETQVLRRGRGPFDFRPGLPLQLFWSVFVRRPGLPSEMQAVSHVEQMHVSGCFRGGQAEARIGCISCHDPHVLPEPAEAAAYYRARCAKCHEEGRNGCSLDRESRRAQNGDDCAACHMPKTRAADVAHAAVTDHRIPRRPSPAAPAAEPGRPRVRGEIPIVAFHRDLPGVEEKDANRDLGLALVAMARLHLSAAPQIGQAALPFLEEAVQDWPRDVPSWEGKGFALWMTGQLPEALEAYEMALGLAPEREQSLVDAAGVLGKLQRPGEALALWRRALLINPASADYQAGEAAALARLGDWPAAAVSARKAIALNPLLVPPRTILVTACANTGQIKAGRKEYQDLMALRPKHAEQLRRTFQPVFGDSP